jgi:hypothetical protein
MTERERLIKLLRESSHELTSRCVGDCGDCADKIADYLLENGVIVLPVKIGDEINDQTVCGIEYTEALGRKGTVCQKKKIYICDKGDTEKMIFGSHTMTWEEALKERDNK